MSQDLVCVHRARDVGEGDIVVSWLEEPGIAAMVKNRHAAALRCTTCPSTFVRSWTRPFSDYRPRTTARLGEKNP